MAGMPFAPVACRPLLRRCAYASSCLLATYPKCQCAHLLCVRLLNLEQVVDGWRRRPQCRIKCILGQHGWRRHVEYRVKPVRSARAFFCVYSSRLSITARCVGSHTHAGARLRRLHAVTTGAHIRFKPVRLCDCVGVYFISTMDRSGGSTIGGGWFNAARAQYDPQGF
jgi:hypothetical protein